MNLSRNIIVALFIFLCLVSISAVSAHDSDNPGVIIDNPSNNEEISGEVDINVTIDDHYETQYVNFTVEGIDHSYSWASQDKNPSDGWNTKWDTSNCLNGKYYIQAKAMNSLGLTGEYNVFVTLSNKQKDANLNVDNISAAVNQKVNVIAKLFDSNNKAISNKNIKFLIDGNEFSAITDSSGISSIDYTPKKVGKFNVTSTFAGDNIYKSVSVNSILISILNQIQLNSDPITAETNEKINLLAKLTSSVDNVSTSGKTVDFKVDGDFVGSAISDDAGIASLEYLVSKSGGNYIYSASLNETGLENPLTTTNLLYVPQSELYMTLTSDKSGVKVGDEVTITYNVFNNGPDNAKNTIFRYTIPDSLKFISAKVTVGEYSYDSSKNEITWNLGSIPVGRYSLDLKMLSVIPARNNLTPSLTTDTYDESIANGVPTRYLTVEGDVIGNNTSGYAGEHYGGINGGHIYYSNLGANQSGNPISLLLALFFIMGVGFKIKR